MWYHGGSESDKLLKKVFACPQCGEYHPWT
jgi:predicted RNA-binding Zn-ribbon protein involved in translation (DUF1610 family)